MKTAITNTVLLLVVAANTAGHTLGEASLKQPVRFADAVPAYQSDGTPCMFDFEVGDIPHCMYQNAKGELLIAPQVLKELRFDAHGLAALRSAREGWMYVNRRGEVVVTGVPVMDNWADSFHDGLVRIVRNGKYGFANRSGRVVIAPVYDGAMNFEKGKAAVCKGCESKCADPGCEHHLFAGGEWFRINTKGIVVARLHADH